MNKKKITEALNPSWINGNRELQKFLIYFLGLVGEKFGF
jgi:hypothetical protein